MSSVEPASGKVGDVLVAQGTNLDRDTVAALYLTDGTTDIKVAIIEHSATSIQFRIPPEAKPGRFALMVLTKGKDPKLIEEPVKITVEPETTSSTISSGLPERLEMPCLTVSKRKYDTTVLVNSPAQNGSWREW